MSSTETNTLSPEQRNTLLEIARNSIQNGLREGCPLPVNPEDFDPDLREHRASFVTLNRQGQLRGCIGHLQAIQPLVRDVAENAYSAAFNDNRFPPLSEPEFRDLDIHISVLSPAEPMEFDSEGDLLQQLRPGIDGLILEDGYYRGTFLPSVWEQLPTPELFLAHLKQKAGLPPNYWSDTLRVSRYTTESFGKESLPHA
jgi:AmmeMemoRadiSam system protein A